MNLEESSEGSSCNGQENGDEFNDSERPLKKARFAWQVKGKYHLKKENNDSNKISNKESTASDTAGPSSSGSNSSNSNNMGTQQHIDTIDETIDGCIMNKNSETLDSVVDEPDKSVPKPSTRDNNILQDPVYFFTPSVTEAEIFSTQDDTERSIFQPIDAELDDSQDSLSNYMMFTRTDEWEVDPVSMVKSKDFTEEQCIVRWQARQIAKGHLDNTVNSVLNYMTRSPIVEDISTLEVFDVADSINNLPEVDSIENEGILMAISAHGLQNTSNSSSSSMNMDHEDICTLGIKSPALKISYSPIHSDDESHEESPCEIKNALQNVQWSYLDELKNEGNETITSPTFHGTTSLTFYENLHNADAASNDVAIIENDNHNDVLDAAVLSAIQCKGLTTFGTDYG